MKTEYPARIVKDGQALLVIFPDFPETATEGQDEVYDCIRGTSSCVAIGRSAGLRHHNEFTP